MNNNKFLYLFILALLLINITLIHGFTSIYPKGTSYSGKISFFENTCSNGMLIVTFLGYAALIYVFMKFIDENMKK